MRSVCVSFTMMPELGFLMGLMLGPNYIENQKKFFEVEKNDMKLSVLHLQIRKVFFEGFPWTDVTWIISSAISFLSGLSK